MFHWFARAQSSQGNSASVSSLSTCYETLPGRWNIHLLVPDKVLMTDKQTINIKVPQMPSFVNQYIYWSYLQEHTHEFTYRVICHSRAAELFKDPQQYAWWLTKKSVSWALDDWQVLLPESLLSWLSLPSMLVEREQAFHPCCNDFLEVLIFLPLERRNFYKTQKTNKTYRVLELMTDQTRAIQRIARFTMPFTEESQKNSSCEG